MTERKEKPQQINAEQANSRRTERCNQPSKAREACLESITIFWPGGDITIAGREESKLKKRKDKTHE